MPTAAERRQDLVALFKQVRACTMCPLHESRTQVVFGAGNADADLMFVGEAPGFHEDQQGVPFVGRAGQLLDQLLAGHGLERGDVFIANVLKSRPPENRDPAPAEIETCKPYLFRQIELIQPTIICTLGNFSTKLLRGSSEGITRVHGQAYLQELGERTVWLYPLFHPAAALRTPKVKEMLAADFGRLPELLALGPPAQRGDPPPPPPAREDDGERDDDDLPEVSADQLGLFG